MKWPNGPNFYIKMSVLLTGASWRADQVVITPISGEITILIGTITSIVILYQRTRDPRNTPTPLCCPQGPGPTPTEWTDSSGANATNPWEEKVDVP